MMMVGCKKTEEGEGPSGGNGTDTAAVVKHNVELVYGPSLAQWQNISLDTLQKYNNDKSVDTIFMVPESSDMWSTAGSTGLKNIIIELRPRHDVNPDKVFGKGDLKLSSIMVDHPEIVSFFADTLKYNVIYNNGSKSR